MTSNARTGIDNEKDMVAGVRDIPKIFLTFILVLIAWVFFKAGSLSEALVILEKMIFGFRWEDLTSLYPKRFLLVLLFIAVEWYQRDKLHLLQINFLHRRLRYLVYTLIVLGILFGGTYNYTPFIYFQF